MAGSEELGLREDTLRVLAAFLRRGEAAGSPVPNPPRSPAQEEPTDFLSRLRRCLPCSLGRGAAPSESPLPWSLPIRPCYGSEPGPATPDFYALVAQRLEQQEQLKSPPSPAGLGPRPCRSKRISLASGSFARLVELFCSREDSSRPSRACPGPPPPSQEPLALAMELSRGVAELGDTRAGLSVEHAHSLTPWIQAHGGLVSR
ncbi:bcl-2-like protein 12 isoform X1 [Gorilla gorilla gorilla]